MAELETGRGVGSWPMHDRLLWRESLRMPLWLGSDRFVVRPEDLLVLNEPSGFVRNRRGRDLSYK